MFSTQKITFILINLLKVFLSQPVTRNAIFKPVDNTFVSNSFDITNNLMIINFKSNSYCLAQCYKNDLCKMVSTDAENKLCYLYKKIPFPSQIIYLSNKRIFKKYSSQNSCGLGEIYDGWSCIQKLGINQYCNSSLPCDDSAGLVCSSSQTCTCPTNKFYFNSVCSVYN
jgi:hypothetical protein